MLTLAYSNDSLPRFNPSKKRSAKCERLSSNSATLPPVVQKVWVLCSKRPHGAALVEELVDRLLRDVE